MAEGKITITIIGIDGGGGGGGDDSSVKKKKEKKPADIMQEALNKIFHPIKSAESAIKDTAVDLLGGSNTAIAAVGLGAEVLGDALSTAYSIAMMEHNRYFTLTEDYVGQNKINIVQTQIGTAKSMLSSIGSGAIRGGVIGSVAGPIGTAIGAVVGSISSGIKTGIMKKAERDQKIEQSNMQLNAINAQTEFMASRANLINGGRGTEN